MASTNACAHRMGRRLCTSSRSSDAKVRQIAGRSRTLAKVVTSLERGGQFTDPKYSKYVSTSYLLTYLPSEPEANGPRGAQAAHVVPGACRDEEQLARPEHHLLVRGLGEARVPGEVGRLDLHLAHVALRAQPAFLRAARVPVSGWARRSSALGGPLEGWRAGRPGPWLRQGGQWRAAAADGAVSQLA